MNNEIQWFCHHAVVEGLLTRSQCKLIADAFIQQGVEEDLEVFVQTAIDNELCTDLERLEELANLALQEAGRLRAPPSSVFAGAEECAAPREHLVRATQPVDDSTTVGSSEPGHGLHPQWPSDEPPIPLKAKPESAGNAPGTRADAAPLPESTEVYPEEPALWNPNAATLWSLAFHFAALGTRPLLTVLSPLFGQIVIWRNWIALGDNTMASAQKRWILVTIALPVAAICVDLLVGGGIDGPVLSFVYLLIWNFVSARKQVQHVKEEFGSDYPRRGWLVPLSLATVATTIAFMMVDHEVASITDEQPVPDQAFWGLSPEEVISAFGPPSRTVDEPDLKQYNLVYDGDGQPGSPRQTAYRFDYGTRQLHNILISHAPSTELRETLLEELSTYYGEAIEPEKIIDKQENPEVGMSMEATFWVWRSADGGHILYSFEEERDGSTAITDLQVGQYSPASLEEEVARIKAVAYAQGAGEVDGGEESQASREDKERREDLLREEAARSRIWTDTKGRQMEARYTFSFGEYVYLNYFNDEWCTHVNRRLPKALLSVKDQVLIQKFEALPPAKATVPFAIGIWELHYPGGSELFYKRGNTLVLCDEDGRNTGVKLAINDVEWDGHTLSFLKRRSDGVWLIQTNKFSDDLRSFTGTSETLEVDSVVKRLNGKRRDDVAEAAMARNALETVDMTFPVKGGALVKDAPGFLAETYSVPLQVVRASRRKGQWYKVAYRTCSNVGWSRPKTGYVHANHTISIAEYERQLARQSVKRRRPPADTKDGEWETVGDAIVPKGDAMARQWASGLTTDRKMSGLSKRDFYLKDSGYSTGHSIDRDGNVRQVVPMRDMPLPVD